MMNNLLPPEGVEVLTVSAVTTAVRTVLEKKFASIWVGGEVSNVSRPNSGHVYFKLKDSGSTLNSVMYRGVQPT